MNLNAIKGIRKIFLPLTLVVVLLYSIISFATRLDHPSAVTMSWIAVITSAVCILYIVIETKHVYGHSLAFLTYLILTQFGTCLVVYVIPLAALPDRGYYNTNWIRANSYPNAVQLGIIAVIVFTLVVVWRGNKLTKKKKQITSARTAIAKHNFYQPIAWLGLVIVGGIFFLLIYLIISGSINIRSSYINFLSYSQSNVGIWSLAMFLLPTGVAFVVTMGNQLDKKILYIFYVVIAIILFLTGNKGEVLYTVLAIFGVYSYKKNMISKKIIVSGLLLLFIIIPTISSLRTNSVLEGYGKYVVSASDPLIETGYQIRLSVFMIDGIASGTRDYLWGFSYYNPLMNIINRLLPFISRLETPSNFNFQTTYDTMGFSQVAESYANFGWFGVVIFYFILGLFLAKFDNTDVNSPKSALYAGWLIIFIIMTRNVFAFVLGQMLIVFIIWKFAMILCKNMKRHKLEM